MGGMGSTKKQVELKNSFWNIQHGKNGWTNTDRNYERKEWLSTDHLGGHLKGTYHFGRDG